MEDSSLGIIGKIRKSHLNKQLDSLDKMAIRVGTDREA